MPRVLTFDPGAAGAADSLYELISTSAETHGENSEGWPTTVGDLEVALSACLTTMTPGQLRAVYEQFREDIADNHPHYDEAASAPAQPDLRDGPVISLRVPSAVREVLARHGYTYLCDEESGTAAFTRSLSHTASFWGIPAPTTVDVFARVGSDGVRLAAAHNWFALAPEGDYHGVAKDSAAHMEVEVDSHDPAALETAIQTLHRAVEAFFQEHGEGRTIAARSPRIRGRRPGPDTTRRS